MRARILVLAILAIAVGYGTFAFTQQWLAAERASLSQSVREVVVQPEPARLFVLVALRDLPPGRFLQAREDVRWQAWPDEDVPETYIVRDREMAPETLEELLGVVSRTDLPAGQPIGTNQIVRPGERGFLAAALRPGMRAVTVSIGDRSGIAGLIHPGDRVDLLLGQSIAMFNVENEDDRIPVQVSETIMRDVRVIALDQRMGPPGEGARMPSTATLEVTPQQVEMVHVMAQLGTISLSLRSLSHTRPDGTEVPDKQLPLASMADPLRGVFARLDLPQPAAWPSIAPGRSFTTDRSISPVLGILDDLYTPIPEPDGATAEEPPDDLTVTIFRGSAGGGSSTTTVVGPSADTLDPAEPEIMLEGPET